MYRITKKEKDYKKYQKGETRCYFCKPEPKAIIKKIKNFYIMKNNFPYDFWDGQKVLEHLLIVSNQHLPDLENQEDKLLEYSKQLNIYNQSGYDIFTRVPNSPSRSQIHFHSHLIKASGKKFRMLTYIKDPYKLKVKY